MKSLQGGIHLSSRKNTFIITPVYKDEGESMRDILLKLMLADFEPA